MSKQLRKKVAVLVLALTTMTSQIVPVFGATTTQTTTQSVANVSEWASQAVKEFMGTSYKDTYNYKFKCTRAEFAEILERALTNLGYEFSEPTKNPFKDTNNKSVIKLYNAGFLAGTSATVFGAGDSLTREQLAVIICRVYDKMGVKMPNTVTYSIKDEAKVAVWARESVKRAYTANIIKGDTIGYVPKAIVSREQAIVICYRTVGTVNQIKEDIKKAQEEATKVPPSTVVTNSLYTYDSATKVITINKSCTIDKSVTGTPTDFTKVTVADGVTATFKGINITNLTVGKNAHFVSEGCTIGTVTLNQGDFTSDKATKVTTLTTYGSVAVKSTDSTIGTVTIFEGTSSNKVSISGVIATLNVDAPVTLAVTGGEIGTISINAQNSDVDVSANTDTINIKKDDVTLDVNADRLSDLTVSGESQIYVAKNTKLKNLDIDEDGVGSKITLKSKYDIEISVEAKCTINGNAVTKKSKVTYEEGKLTIDGEDSPTVTEEDKSVESAETALTMALILGDNNSETSIVNDLNLVTKLKNCSITWTSSNEAVVSTSGKVTRVDKDSEVELRAQIKNGDTTTNKVFKVKVLAKEVTQKPVDTNALLDTALGKITIPTSTATPFVIPLTVDGYAITVSATENNVTLSKGTNGTTVTPVQSTVDQTATLTLVATSDAITRTKTVTFQIPKKVTVDNPTNNEEEETAIATLKAELNAIQFPSTVTGAFTVPNKTAKGYEITYTCPMAGVSINKTSTGTTITPPNADTELNLSVDVTDGKYKYSDVVSITVKKEVAPEVEVTKELIEADMGKILSQDLLPNVLSSQVDLPSTYNSSYVGVSKYSATLQSSGNYVTFKLAEDKYNITPNNLTLTANGHQQVKVILTTIFKGETVTKDYTYNLTIVPKYTEDDLKTAIQSNIGARATELAKLFPTDFAREEFTIPYYHEFVVSGIDFGMSIVPQIGPYAEASSEADKKLSITYNKDNTFTISPKVSDGSVVDLKVNFTVQLGGTSISVPKTIQVTLPGSASVENEGIMSAVIESEIYEILNSIDIQILATEDVGPLNIVVLDKYLKTELGSLKLTAFEKKAESVYVAKGEVSTSKNALLGEYSYQIYKDSKLVREGDLLNGTITPYSSKEIQFMSVN